MRDWLRTLFPASYKGVPFWVEADEETGGRRIAEHQFPMRDLPYLEDLGEDLRKFSVEAYVASDAADSQAAALVAACASRGPGTLVLPLHGGITARCKNFSRQRSKDRHGKLAFKLDFLREGAGFALASVASLANLIFVGANVMGSVSGAALAAAVRMVGQPDYVAAGATAALQDAAAMLEAIRSTDPVTPAASRAQRDAIQTLYDSAEAALIADPGGVAASLVAIARGLGDGMAPDVALRAFAGYLGQAQPLAPDDAKAMIAGLPYQTTGAKQQARNRWAVERAMRIAVITAYCEAIARVPLTDRPMAITLRANTAEFFEAEFMSLTGAQIELYHALQAIRDSVISYLSRSILDLAPVISIEANMRLPSLYWAWRLYKDPARSTELVARNLVIFPSMMPNDFEALSR